MTCYKFLSNIYYVKVKNCFCKLIRVFVHPSIFHKCISINNLFVKNRFSQ